MSISHSDISAALRAAGHNPDECQITFDLPGPDYMNVTNKLGLSHSVIRDLETDGLEVYAPKVTAITAKILRVAGRILGKEEPQ